jgi:hypothetical protein
VPSLTRVLCPSCLTYYRITEGKKGRCPRCRVELVPVEVPTLEYVEESPPRLSVRERRVPGAWGGHGRILACLVGVVLIGWAVIGAGLWWMCREDSQQIEREIREMNERHRLQMLEIEMKAKQERLELERP